jgi:hypothetical protein
MASNDPVAIYAAVVATAVLAWDFWKWKRERRLDLVGRIAPGMIPTGGTMATGAPRKKYVSLQVDNRGHAVCEVQSMVVLPYDNWWKALRYDIGTVWLVPDAMSNWTQKRLPFRLEHGGTYWGLCEQTEELERASREKRVYVAITHNMSAKPFRVRLKPIEKDDG